MTLHSAEHADKAVSHGITQSGDTALGSFSDLLTREYRLLSLAWSTNHARYGMQFHRDAAQILELVHKLAACSQLSFAEVLQRYHAYVVHSIQEHKTYLKQRCYRFNRLSDLERSDQWPRHQQDYPFILLLSTILSTHRYEIFRWFRECIAALPAGGRCLEIGSGVGLDADYLSRSFSMEVYDTSPFAAQCIDVLFPHLRGCFRNATYDFRHVHRYDVAVLIEVLEHVEQPDQLLTGTRRVLRTGGHALFTFAIRMPQLDHLYHFGSIDECRALLASCDLAIESDFYTISSLLPLSDKKKQDYVNHPDYAANYCCLAVAR